MGSPTRNCFIIQSRRAESRVKDLYSSRSPNLSRVKPRIEEEEEEDGLWGGARLPCGLHAPKYGHQPGPVLQRQTHEAAPVGEDEGGGAWPVVGQQLLGHAAWKHGHAVAAGEEAGEDGATRVHATAPQVQLADDGELEDGPRNRESQPRKQRPPPRQLRQQDRRSGRKRAVWVHSAARAAPGAAASARAIHHERPQLARHHERPLAAAVYGLMRLLRLVCVLAPVPHLDGARKVGVCAQQEAKVSRPPLAAPPLRSPGTARVNEQRAGKKVALRGSRASLPSKVQKQ